MSNRQKLIFLAVVLLSVIIGFDFYKEDTVHLAQKTADIESKYAHQIVDSFGFLDLDTITRLDKLSDNVVIGPGEYIVCENPSNQDQTQLHTGKFALCNNQQKSITFSLNGEEMSIPGTDELTDNYLIIDLYDGDILKTNSQISLKSILFSKEINE